MKRVVLVTNQYAESKSKAGFHWLADAFWDAGWEVVFFTESISWISWLRGDPRFAYPIFRQANQLRPVRERFWSYVWLTPFHPLNSRRAWLNCLTGRFLRTYGLLPLSDIQPTLAGADLFVFDSDHGLFLFDRFKKWNPHARFVYRVSDDLPTMRHHPIVLKTERRLVKRFDLVSVPSGHIENRLSAIGPVRLHKHALRREPFDQACVNPFACRGGPNVVFVGKKYLDHDFMERATRLFPEWSFHVFGSQAGLQPRGNLVLYGERPFTDLVPYLRHADIGLQTLQYTPGAECFTDSLKMQQYTYCRLPIVAPQFLRTTEPHVFYYEPGKDPSIARALLDASQFDRERVPWRQVTTWDHVIQQLAG